MQLVLQSIASILSDDNSLTGLKSLTGLLDVSNFHIDNNYV